MGENPFESLCHHPSSVEDETDFFMRELRSLEFRAYAAILSAFRAGGELDEEKRGVLGLIREKLNISELRHKSEVRRVATNPRLATIANKIHGCNTNQEWIDEGFCESPYVSGMSRFPPAKISDRLLSSIDKTEKRKEKKRKFSTAHDFGRAIKTERPLDPSAPVPNGWGSDIEVEKGNFEKIIKAEMSSSSSCESESSVDISYTSLKKKGRIRLQKRSMLKLKKIKHEHEEKMGLSVVPSSSPPPQHQQQPSPDVVEATSPVKREAVQPSSNRRGRGAKRKILCPTTGKIKLSPVPRKQVRLDEQTGQPIVESRRGGLSRGRGSRGGMRRGGLANGRGKVRLGMKPGQGRVLKIKTPKIKKDQQQQQIQQQQAPQQSKRKQLDEIRQELKSDESDREKDTEKSEPLKRSSSTESVNRDTSSESESEVRGKHSDSARPPLVEKFRSSPKQVPVSASSESEAELRTKEVVEPRRESSPAVNSGMNFLDKSKTPPKAPPRSPLPAPVFSTSLDSVNKKRANKILNNFAPMSSEGMSSSASGVPTASSLAARRPPIFSSTPPSVSKPPGILPQRKAQPHILVNSKAQRNIANAAITSSSSSIASTLNSGTSVPLVSSSVIQPQQQNVINTNPQAPKVGSFGPSFPVVSSLGMGTPSFSSMKTSQGANIILLQKTPGGGLSPATATVVGSNASIMSSAVSGSPIMTSGTGVGGVPLNPAGMQQLPPKNSPRAVILRRANLPRQGNVMILDMQKNLVSANQVPQFLQTARILNTPELALMANIQNQGNAVRKIVTSAGQVVSSGIGPTSVASVTVSTSGGLSVATSCSNAVNHGIPLRFPINSSQLQQLQQQQQQQQSAQLKAKRVGRVFSPRDLKTVIRVSAVPVQTAPVLPVPTATTSSNTPAGEPKVPPKEQPDTLLASASSHQPIEEQEAILQETVYEEVVSSDRSESTNIQESCNEQVVPLESSNNNSSDQLLPIEDRTVEISSECNNQFIPTQVEVNGDDDDDNAQEEIITESVVEDFIINTGEISSSTTASGFTEDVFQTALKSAGLDFSGNDDDFAMNDEGTCTNVADYPVQHEIAVSTAPSEFPYRAVEVPINEEVVTTQH